MSFGEKGQYVVLSDLTQLQDMDILMPIDTIKLYNN